MLSKFLLFTSSTAILWKAKEKKQPIVDSRNTGYSQGQDVDTDANFAISAQDAAAGKTSGANYRNAWNDCGGIGASETEKTRILSAKIKGFAKPVPFVRHAAQDCSGQKGVAFPGQKIWDDASNGRRVAEQALDRK